MTIRTIINVVLTNPQDFINTPQMTIRTIINVVLTNPQDFINTPQMTIRTIINVVLTNPQDFINTPQMTIRTIINVVLTNPQDIIKTLLWGCILNKWNSPSCISHRHVPKVNLRGSSHGSSRSEASGVVDMAQSCSRSDPRRTPQTTEEPES